LILFSSNKLTERKKERKLMVQLTLLVVHQALKALKTLRFRGFLFFLPRQFFVGRRIVEIADFCTILTFQVNASAKRNGPAEAGPDNS
jgi:hypothetical protein